MTQDVPTPLLDTPEGRKQLWDYLIRNKEAGVSIDTPENFFLGLCLAHYSASVSQVFQDLYVLYKLRQKRGGYFVEFGAMDGVAISNTYRLEQSYGWRGVLAEPNPVFHKAIKENRKAVIDRRCVWRESGAKLDFDMAALPELSSIAGFSNAAPTHKVTVDSVSLRDLLREHNAPAIVDYLSVDTEGSELEILQAFDFSYRFRVITVEHNYKSAAREALHVLLGSRGYVREFEAFSRWDDWYFHPELMS